MEILKRYKKIVFACVISVVPLLSQANSAFYRRFNERNLFQSLQVKRLGYPSGSPNATTQDAGTYVRGLKDFHDDRYGDQKSENIKLTKDQYHQALVWGLTKNDEKRYVMLMQNRSGLYWKGAQLSPVEILGINARNPQERRRLALLYAKQLQEKIAKELAWQFLASRAKAKVNKGLPLIKPFNVRQFNPYNYQAIGLRSGDQLFLLTRINLNVQRVVSTLLAGIQSQKNITLNNYFVGNPSSKEIQNWAKNQSIPVTLVKKGEITINTNEGPFSHFGNMKKLPILIVVREGKATSIDLSRF
jgi:integrating conjugative element protein (TIGR03759 family)